MGRREENKRRKREALRSHGLDLFLELGFDGASIEQLATRADMARGTFYLYFPTKLDLYEAIIDTWFLPLLACLDHAEDALGACETAEQTMAVYAEMTQTIALLGLTHRREVELAFRSARAADGAGQATRAREGQLHDRAVRLTVVARHRGLIETEDEELTAFLVMGAVERLFFAFLSDHPSLVDPMAVSQRALGMLGRMLGLRPGAT